MAGELTRPSLTNTNAVPSVGCPANGSSAAGVKIRIAYRSPPLSVTNVVSENPISFASACIVASSRSIGLRDDAELVPGERSRREHVDEPEGDVHAGHCIG